MTNEEIIESCENVEALMDALVENPDLYGHIIRSRQEVKKHEAKVKKAPAGKEKGYAKDHLDAVKRHVKRQETDPNAHKEHTARQKKYPQHFGNPSHTVPSVGKVLKMKESIADMIRGKMIDE